MKKKLCILSLTLLIVSLLGIGMASAAVLDTTTPHGNYAADTDACVACHATHTAGGDNLIRGYLPNPTSGAAYTEMFRVCMYCHNGSGSNYDVFAGQQATASGSVVTPAGPISTSMTSIHNVMHDGYNAAPGNPESTIGIDKFSCGNCHFAHGNTGSDRLLRKKVTLLGAVVNGTATSITKSTTVSFKRTTSTVNYDSGVNEFCALCHDSYDSNDAKKMHMVATEAANAPQYKSLHGLPLEDWNVDANGKVKGKLICLTCHKAHSSSAAMNGRLAEASSALLRKDNRGVCIACHDWNNPQ